MKTDSQKISRRAAVTWLAAGALTGATRANATEAAYPSRPVQLVVPTTVGGGADLLARMFGQKFAEATGQQAVVNNIPGAGGVIGVQKVTSSKADGYTVLFGFNQITTMNPSLIPQLGYDVNRDLMPVTLLADQPYVWIANRQFAANTLKEFVALAKGPERITFAHNGTGSAANLAAEMFMQLTGGSLLGVPYKNNATPDLLAGVVQLKMEPASIALPLIRAGTVKAIAVTSASRLVSLPEIPAMAEMFPALVFNATYSVWAPAGTPLRVVQKLNTEFTRIVRDKAFADKLIAMSIRPVGSSAAELLSETQTEFQALSKLVKSRNIKVES